jgi:VanZ family protein
MAANFLLAFPTAFFAMGFFNSTNGSRFILAGMTVLLLCSGLSLASECGQLWIPNRVPSWTDIVMQHFGALAGITTWKFSGRTVTDWFGQLVSYERSERRWDLLLEL